METSVQQTIRSIILTSLDGRALGNRAEQSLTSGDGCAKLELLFHRLVETNEHMNVTAITELERVALLHFADSISAEAYIPEGASVIDVGCGGGFPSLPLAIVRPDISILSLDSTAKKLTFVQGVADELSLNIRTLAARAEDAASGAPLRESFDVAISRAVARLNILSELCIPFVKASGLFIAMKGQGGDAELEQARAGISRLGCDIRSVEHFSLLDSGERALIICQKGSRTPAQYPRPYAKIKKTPL